MRGLLNVRADMRNTARGWEELEGPREHGIRVSGTVLDLECGEVRAKSIVEWGLGTCRRA